GMSDNGAGGNLLVEERHIDLVRVGPPEVGIRVVRSAIGTSGFFEKVLVLCKSRLFESRNSDVPSIVGVVRRTVAKVHVDGPEGILPAGGIVTEDHCVAGPCVPANEYNLASDGGEYGERRGAAA